jgi:hypothetical protein
MKIWKEKIISFVFETALCTRQFLSSLFTLAFAFFLDSPCWASRIVISNPSNGGARQARSIGIGHSADATDHKVSQIPRSSARVPHQGLGPARASCMARDVLCYLCYTRRSSFARKSHSINLNFIGHRHWLGDIVLGMYGLTSPQAQATTQTLVVTSQCQCTEEKVEVVGTQRDQGLDRHGRFPGKPAPSPGTAIHPSRPDQGCGPSVCRPQHP